MTQQQHDHRSVNATAEAHAGHAGHAGHGGHGWMMVACCIPMLVIAIALVISGVVSVGFLFAALACTAMMALMMRGMHAGQDAQQGKQDARDHSNAR